MTEPTIGVVIATHDGERYLPEQLTSILDGARRPDHVILTDDASSDGTVDLARNLLADSGIVYEIIVNRPALGVAANVAGAVARARTDVVVFSDQDDRWHPDRLTEVAAAFADPELVLLHGDADLIDSEGVSLGATLFERLEVQAAELDGIAAGRAFEVYLRRNLATGATMAVRRAAIDDALDVPVGWVHDEWLAVVAATRGRVAVLRRPLIDYRQHAENQIGVAEPTLRRKVLRVLGADNGRLARLAARSASLASFLESAGADAHIITSARAKAAFEARREALPAGRIARVPGVVSGLVSGDYARYASRGRLDVLRDLLQVRHRGGAGGL